MSFIPHYPLVVFLHIPKAAGSTINSVLRQNYRKDQTAWLSTDFKKHVAELKVADARANHGLRLIAGHFRFGIHRFLEPVRDVSYFAFFRHPHSRLFSFYHYILKTPEHYYHETLKNSGETFLDFIRNPKSPEIHNQQTRLVAGCNTAPTEVDDKELERALANLRDQFFTVGLQERFDESLVLLKLKLGLQDIFYASANENKRKPRYDFDQEVLRELDRANVYDLILYKHVQEKFEEQIQALGSQFTEELERFKMEKQSQKQRARTMLTVSMRKIRKLGRVLR